MAYYGSNGKDFRCSGVVEIKAQCEISGFAFEAVFGLEYYYSSGYEPAVCSNRDHPSFSDPGEDEEIVIFGAELLKLSDESGPIIGMPETVAEDLADNLIAKIKAGGEAENVALTAIRRDAHDEDRCRRLAENKPILLFEALSAPYAPGTVKMREVAA